MSTLESRLKTPAFRATHEALLVMGFRHRWDPEHPEAGTTYSHPRMPKYLTVFADGSWRIGSLGPKGSNAQELRELMNREVRKRVTQKELEEIEFVD